MRKKRFVNISDLRRKKSLKIILLLLFIMGVGYSTLNQSLFMNAHVEVAKLKVTVGSGEYLAHGTKSGTDCPAGNFCPGNTFSYDSVNDQGIVSCAVGSYSAAKSGTCTPCQGNTTSSVGSTTCDAECSNKSGVSTWENTTWNNNNTMTNLCTISTCKTGYTKDGNSCTANNYTVTLNNDNATTPGSASVTATYDSSIPTITPPTKRGYTFQGYYYIIEHADPTPDEEILYIKSDGTSNKNWDLTSDVTLIAKWEAISITCEAGEYLPGDGTSCSSCPEGYSCSGGDYNYNPTTDQGSTICQSGTYSTGGATTCSICTGGVTNEPGANSCSTTCSNAAHVASWVSSCTIATCDTGYENVSNSCTARKFNITLNNKNATTAGSTTVEVTYNSPVPSITIPEKTGYTFGGYYTEEDGAGTRFIKEDGTSAKNWDVTNINTLYAKWTLISKTCSAGQYLPQGTTTCSPCPAGSFCIGGTYNYKANEDQGITACAIGTYSGASSNSCTACTGTTTTAIGQTSCNASCSNNSNVSTWNSGAWNNNTPTGICSIATCAVGYSLSSNTCTANELNFSNQTINIDYTTEAVTKNVTAPTTGTGTYSYSKKSGESDITVSSAGVITIPASKVAGTYTVVITANDSNSHKTKDATYTINVQKVNATLTCSNKTYDGTEQTACTCSGGTIGGTYKATNYSSTAYTASCTADGNHNSPSNKTWTMSKKAITITAKPQTVNYGTAISKTTSDVTVATLATGDSLTAITLTQSTTDYTTNGTITPSAATIKRSGTNVTSNYNITYNTGVLKIDKVAATLSCSNKTYDGTEQTACTCTGGTIGGTYKATNASDTAYTASCTPDSNHTAPSNATWTMSRKAVTITAKAQTVDYGTAISKTTSDVTVDTLASGDSLTAITLAQNTTDYTTNGTITPSAATIKRSSTDVTSNYNISYATGILKINKVEATLSCSNKTYDGTEQTACTCTGGTIGGTYKATNYSSTAYTASCTGDGNHTSPSNKTWTMSKKSITITAKPQTVDYGTAISKTTNDVTVATLISGDSLTAITLTQSTTNYTTNGTITPSAATIMKNSTNVTNNYNITYATGLLKINKVAATLTCENKTYNGSEQTACTCTGGTVGGTYKATNASTTAYTASCTGDGNHTSPSNKTWTMSKKQIGAINNLAISNTGVVSWTNSTDATSYQISVDNTNWTSVSAGTNTTSYNFLNTIVGSAGNRTVYVKAINSDTTNYTPSSTNKSITVYTVTFNRNNNDYGTVSPASINVITGETYSTNNNILTVQDGRTVTATPATITGYNVTFDSWSSTTGTITGATTITANFTSEISKYYVTYNANGGTFSNSTTTNNVVYSVTTVSGSKVVTAESGTYKEPTKTDKIFTKWNTEEDGTGINITTESALSSLTYVNVTLYAQYRDEVVQFAEGSTVNSQIKQLAGNTDATYNTSDSNITTFTRYTGTVTQSLLNNAVIVSSDDSDRDIYAWYDNGTIYWYSTKDTVYLNSDSSYMFQNLTRLSNVGVNDFDTSNVTDMSAMFMSCSSITTLDLTSWNVSSLNTLGATFANMTSLKNINLNGWTTQFGIAPDYLFGGDSVLENVKMDDWVIDRGGGVFTNTNIKYLSAKNWTISYNNIDNLFGRMWNARNIQTIDVTGWKFNPSSISLEGLFADCSKLTDIIGLNTWDTSKVTNLAVMFYGCSSLTNLDLSTFNTSNVTTIASMFWGCSSLKTLNMDDWNLRRLTSSGNNFSGSGLKKVSARNWVTPTDISWLLSYCTAEIIDVTGWDLSNTTDIRYLFSRTKEIIGLNTWDTSNITNMSYLFEGNSMTTFDLSFWDTSQVTNMESMFSGCTKLKTIYADELFITDSVTTSTHMFSGCTSIVGGNGTTYDANHIDKEYARIDGTLLGYFTIKSFYTITYNANGGQFTGNSSTNAVKYRLSPGITKISHTMNVDSFGYRNDYYGNDWSNANIVGNNRGDTSKAHVVSISGASSLTVELYYNGESTSYDWASLWSGSYPNYTAFNNYSSAGAVTTAMGGQSNNKYGGLQTGTYTVYGNTLTNMGHSTLTIPGDTVTFSFGSNNNGYGGNSAGYGYYAIISSNGKILSISGGYNIPTRSGKTFIGWNTKADGTGVSVLDESELDNISMSSTTLYAQYINN